MLNSIEMSEQNKTNLIQFTKFKIVKNLYLSPAAVAISPIAICSISKLHAHIIVPATPIDRINPRISRIAISEKQHTNTHISIRDS